MDFLSGLFGQPGMLVGTLLVAVPIIIYLINRRRFQRRKWAAMEFLLRAMQKNRRRLQLENLLLLLIRCAVIVLLAMAMARPFIRSAALGSRTSQPENWIFAIDTSYSMRLREGTRSLFDTARESLGGIVQHLVKPGDRIAILTVDAHPRVVVPPRQVTEGARGQVLEALADLRPGYESVNLASSLRLVLDVAGDFEDVSAGGISLGGEKLVVFSDFQRRDWVREDAPRDPAVNDLLREFESAGIAVSRADLGGTDRNFAVTDLTMSPPIAVRDVWVEFFTSIRNFGRADFDAVEIVFRVDGVEQPPHLVRLAAGATVTRSLPFRFDTPGHHVVVVEALVDDLAVDNRRAFAVDVRESADVLLVDGEPGATAIERETLLLELALMPDESDEFRRAPYQPVVRSVDMLAGDDPDLGSSLAVVLANVSTDDLPSAFLEDLERWMRGGGALMVFLGKNVVPGDYNRVFGGEAGRLLPLRLLESVDRLTVPVHARFANADHPVARYFLARPDYTYLERPFIEFRRFFEFEEPEEGAAPAIVLRFDDPDESIAAFDAPFGNGRVMWFASTADLEWNDFAKYHDFIPFLHESIPYLVGLGESRLNLSLGEPFRKVFEAHEYSPRVVVIPPRPAEEVDADVPTAVPQQMRKIEGENRFELDHEETSHPGVYEVRLQETPGMEQGAPSRSVLFAVNLDAAEGDLRRLTPEDAVRFFPALPDEVFDAVERVREISSSASSASGTELWRWVLWVVLLLLVAESLVALVFGRSMR